MTSDDQNDDEHGPEGRTRAIRIAVGIAGVLLLLLLVALGIATSKL